MPSPTEILAGLSAIASQAIGAAIAWHAAFAAALLALRRRRLAMTVQLRTANTRSARARTAAVAVLALAAVIR